MPKGVIAELEKIQRQFLWGDYEGKKKLRLVDWNTICKVKPFGGLGIINLNYYNQLLLLKWPWKFRHESHALWKKVICQKYNFFDFDLWSAPCPPFPSLMFGVISNIIGTEAKTLIS